MEPIFLKKCLWQIEEGIIKTGAFLQAAAWLWTVINNSLTPQLRLCSNFLPFSDYNLHERWWEGAKCWRRLLDQRSPVDRDDAKIKNELHGFHTLSHSNTSRSNQTSTSNATCSFSNLSQHLIVLNLVTFGSADFSLQCVLIETSADIDQDSGRAGVDGTAEDHITHAGGDMNPEP